METKTNTGVIFKNDNKTKDTQPNYKGKVNVDGKELEISLWIKTSKAGTSYFSVAFNTPYVKQESATPKEANPTINDLPF